MKKMNLLKLLPFLLLAIFASCGENKTSEINTELESKMNSIAEGYVRLILQMGQHDADIVDAYYGPENLKPAALTVPAGDSATVQGLYDEAGNLLDSLDALSNHNADGLQTLRFKYLYKQMLAAKTKIFMLAGGTLTFEEEAKNLYDAEVPVYSSEHFQSIIDELDNILPGSGDVADRLNEFKKDFIIPKEKLDTVFQTAINECRKRTLQHIELPANESFTIEYVTDKAWSGYNWYKGNSYSLIQINTDLPIYIERAVDLAAHEGYPGHHVYNLLLEKKLYRELNWVEFSGYALFSPQSLIAEGTANYGIEVAFPGDSRIRFEREILFPLAGLDSSKADQYYKVFALTEKLSYVQNEAARNYLNKTWTKDEAINWLYKYGLSAQDRAEQRVRFIEKYRSYVINYNLGKDIVKKYVEANGGTEDNPKKRWELFEHLLSTPQTPSELQK